MSRLCTLDEVSRVTGVNPQTVRNWVSAGLLRPAYRGRTGCGNSHRFTAVQVLAVASAVRHREEGATGERANGVMAFLAGLTAGRLEACLADGRTFPVPATLLQRAAAEEGLSPAFWLPGDLIAPPDRPDLPAGARDLMKRLDVRALWQVVGAKLARLDPRPVPAKRVTNRRGTGKRARTTR